MKRFVLAALAVALVVPAFAVPALADPTVTVTIAPGTMVVPTYTVYGRPNRPMVSIEIRPLSATDAAGAAHDRLRQATLLKNEPATMTR
jgi:hypothetical protein